MRRCYEEVLNKRNMDVIDELIVADIADHNPLGSELPHGSEGVKQGFTMFCAAFPDLNVAVEDVIAERGKVVGRLALRGAQKGEFMNKSNEQVMVAVIEIVRLKDMYDSRDDGTTLKVCLLCFVE